MPNLRRNATFLCRLRSFQTLAGALRTSTTVVGSSIMPAFKSVLEKKKKKKEEKEKGQEKGVN